MPTAFNLDKVQPRRGAAVLVDVLRSEGVRHIFGNPGTTEMPLMDALVGAPDLSYILGLQEASVVAMADGYAKASGRPGFVNVHTAGGLGHGMGSLIAAQVGQTPLVITAGQQDTRHGVTDPLLSGNLVAIAGPVVKWAHEVGRTDDIPLLFRRAFHDCAAAPAGPVFLSLPLDIMDGMTSAGPGQVSRIERAPVAGGLGELSAALAAIAPGRLALIVGDEVFGSGASMEAVALADALGAPVYGSSWPGHIPFPTEHPLWRGSLPHRGTDLQALFGGFDAVFALGGQSVITYVYSPGVAIPAGCKLFQLSASVRELGRSYAAELACVGDIKTSLQALLPLLAASLMPHAAAIGALLQQASQDRTARHREFTMRATAEFTAPLTTPFAAAAEVARAIPQHVAIVDEAPATTAGLRSLLHSPSTRQYYGMRSAILGWGMPAAVGVSLGLDRAPVVCTIGDGAALYSPQALWTAAREKLPVTFVVMNNREYNILKTFMRAQPHYTSIGANRFIGMDITEPPVDYVALAASFGVPACRVESAGEIAGAVEAGIASGRPNLIDVAITPT